MQLGVCKGMQRTSIQQDFGNILKHGVCNILIVEQKNSDLTDPTASLSTQKLKPIMITPIVLWTAVMKP